MGPRWWIIHECGGGGSVQCSLANEVDHLIGGGDPDFMNPTHTDRPIFFIPDVDEIVLHFDLFVALDVIVGEQVDNLLIVDFDEGGLDGEFNFFFPFLNLIEELIHNSGDDANFIDVFKVDGVGAHGVGFATASLSIC